MPVYDCRSSTFNILAKGNLPPVNAPHAKYEPPVGSTVVTGYTVSKNLSKGKAKEGSSSDAEPARLSLNVLWVAILG